MAAIIRRHKEAFGISLLALSAIEGASVFLSEKTTALPVNFFMSIFTTQEPAQPAFLFTIAGIHISRSFLLRSLLATSIAMYCLVKTKKPTEKPEESTSLRQRLKAFDPKYDEVVSHRFLLEVIEKGLSSSLTDHLNSTRIIALTNEDHIQSLYQAAFKAEQTETVRKLLASPKTRINSIGMLNRVRSQTANLNILSMLTIYEESVLKKSSP